MQKGLSPCLLKSFSLFSSIQNDPMAALCPPWGSQSRTRHSQCRAPQGSFQVPQLVVWPSCQLQRASSWIAGPWLLHQEGDLHHGPRYPHRTTLCAGLLSCYFRTFGHQAFRNDHLQPSQGLTDSAMSSLHSFASKKLLFYYKSVLPSKAQDSSAEVVCSDFFMLLLPPNTTLAAPTVCWLLANT